MLLSWSLPNLRPSHKSSPNDEDRHPDRNFNQLGRVRISYSPPAVPTSLLPIHPPIPLLPHQLRELARYRRHLPLRQLREHDVQSLMQNRIEILLRRLSRIDLNQILFLKGLSQSPFPAQFAFHDSHTPVPSCHFAPATLPPDKLAFPYIDAKAP